MKKDSNLLLKKSTGGRGGARKGAGRPRKAEETVTMILRRKRQQGKLNLRTLVDSFDADPSTQEKVRKTLKISMGLWLLYFRYRNAFETGVKNFRTLKFVLNERMSTEFKCLKKVLKKWLESRRCVTDKTLFNKAREVIKECRLDFLDRNWEPSENETWFKTEVWCSRPRPHQKFRELYEWVEAEVAEYGSVKTADVRVQAGVMIGENFHKYKKFEKLSKRIRDFLDLTIYGSNGKSGSWVPKKKTIQQGDNK